MKFKLQDLRLDMNVTPFENMFLNTYVQRADGDALKVYLLIYKEVFAKGRVNPSKIQRQLGFDDDKFNECLDYWVRMGLFREKMGPSGEKYIEIVSLRQAYFGSSESEESNDQRLDLSQRRAAMFSNVETIIQRKLTPSDITRINETLDEYKSDPELVTEAFGQAKKDGNVDVKYVMGYIKTWRDQNIFSLNDLRKAEERKRLVRKKSPRTYRRAGKPIKPDSSSKGNDFTKMLFEERLKKMKEMGEDNESK